MGGRGYHNDVKGYLSSNKRTCEYSKISEISDSKIDFIVDTVSPKAPVAPEFSNSPNKIYALVDKHGKGIKSITFYKENYEQKVSIHLDHSHDGSSMHMHLGMSEGRDYVPYNHKYDKIVNKVISKYKFWRSKQWLKKIWI